jgi:hypothetical protein
MCGQYDSDTCLDWSSLYSCAAGKKCNNGQCVSPAACTNDCSYTRQRICYGSSGYRMCGQYDSDTCLDWSGVYSCSSNYYCSNGECISSYAPPVAL